MNRLVNIARYTSEYTILPSVFLPPLLFHFTPKINFSSNFKTLPRNPPAAAAAGDPELLTMNPPVNQGFWTSCPHCCHVHQYGREYLNRKLRCRICKTPFAAAELPSPPPIVPGTDMYYCSWGYFPLGFPQGSTPSNWTPLIPVHNNGPASTADDPAGRKITARKKICVSKRAVANREEIEEEEEEAEGVKGIDVNEEARVSDLMGEQNGQDGNGGGIGFDIDVDMDATEDIFGLW